MMADRFPAQISIGGQISRTAFALPNNSDDDITVLRCLISCLHNDGASHEYGDVSIDNNCTEKQLLKYQKNGILVFKNDYAVLGEFPDTEEFCQKHGIQFDRWSDHYCEYDSEKVYFRKDMDNLLEITVDPSDEEMIYARNIRKTLSELLKFKANHLNSHIDKAIFLLELSCPDLPDALKEFSIIA